MSTNTDITDITDNTDINIDTLHLTTDSNTILPSKNRCFVCHKRVGLLGFECKCTPGAVFCTIHRYFTEHGCTRNVQGEYKDLLRKQNQVVKAAKLAYV